MKNAKYLIVSLMILVGFGLQAGNLEKGLELFAQRDPELENVKEARTFLVRAIKEESGDRLVEAVDKDAHLAFYEGALVTPEEDLDTRNGIFSKCRRAVEKISPDRLGEEAPAYYYWKATCFGLWAQTVDDMEALPHITDFKQTLRDGMKLKASRTYAGGGIYRVAAAAYVASEKLEMVGLYDVKKAFKLARVAIKLGPEQSGAYLIKAEVLRKMGKDSEANEVLTTLIADLENKIASGTLNPATGPDDKLVLVFAQKMLAGER